jgi:hypothetical protein
MTKRGQSVQTEIEIGAAGKPAIEIKGDLGGLPSDARKVQQLLDLLRVPRGTRVRITTRASSVIVR